MKKIAKKWRKSHGRKGAIALSTAIVLFVLLGLVALSIDVGYLLLTKTQLQAAADAATLSGGTELMAGLGKDPVSATSVETNGSAVAVDYAGKNRNGDRSSTYAEGARDVRFGWALFNPSATPPAWQMNWDTELPDIGGYNLIGVTLRRNVSGSVNGDGPLPLVFARVFGYSNTTLAVDAAAVIMPASGVRIEPGSSTTANLIPFALRQRLWQKKNRAQAYFDANGFPSPIDSVTDSDTGEPLFGHYVTNKAGVTTFVQDFNDLWNCGCSSQDSSSGSTAGADQVLEIDIFPRDDYTSGNLGTVDIGSGGNETSVLSRQIVDGVNEDDLSHYTNNEFVIPRTTEGDTGLSAGIKDDLAAILGQCRVVLLFDGVTNPGNNATFNLVSLAGIQIMDVELTGQLEFKHLTIQECDATLTGATGDIDSQIGSETTVFTPLILIE